MEGNLAIDELRVSAMKIPKINIFLFLSLACIAVGLGAGVYAQLVGHHHAFANSREMPWGMLIGVYAYLAIISTGLCLMAVITHLFHFQRLVPLANRMVWLSLVCLLGGFLVIGLEIENPWRMLLYMVTTPNVTSNIWWMGTLYGFSMGLLGLELILILSNRMKAALILGVGGAITEMMANSNLGSVFGSLAARPFWYGSQLPIFFLASALLSGAAAVILFTYLSYLFQKKTMSDFTFQGVQVAGKVMSVMLFLISLAVVWKLVNGYCGTEELRRSMDVLVKGPLAKQFWIFEVVCGLALPFMLLVVTGMRSLPILVLASILVLVGQFFARYNLVVAGLSVPVYTGVLGQTQYLTYTPRIAEYLLVLGGLGVVSFGFLAGEKVFGNLFCKENEHKGRRS